MDYNGTWEVQITNRINKISADDARVNPSLLLTLAYTASIVDGGYGDGQADSFYAEAGGLGALGILNLNLIGVLTDCYGDAFDPDEIKLIFVKNTSGFASDAVLVIGADPGATGIEWTGWCANAGDRVYVPPLGCFLLIAPDEVAWAVPSGPGDNLAIQNLHAANAATYEVVIIGTS